MISLALAFVTHSDFDAERLIDTLTKAESSAKRGHAVSWREFIATEEPSFEGDVLGPARPTLRVLVQMGVRALPALVRHLSDARETKLVEENEDGGVAMWFGDEYDPRSMDPTRRLSGVNRQLEELVSPASYTVRIGDLCYVAVGQIVNRDLTALRQQPTACEVIDSPVHTPALAAAVAHDWAGLTSEEHERSLENDAYGLWGVRDALWRLLFYYPSAGEAVALRLLHRRFYDSTKVAQFAERMVATADANDWRRLFSEAKGTLGPVATLIPREWDYWRMIDSPLGPRRDSYREQAIVKAIFPSYDPYQNRFYDFSDFGKQTTLVEALRSFSDTKIDIAVQDLFRRAVVASTKGRNDIDDLAIACADRMVGKGFDAEYAGYFKRRIVEVGAVASKPSRLKELQRWAKRMAL